MRKEDERRDRKGMLFRGQPSGDLEVYGVTALGEDGSIKIYLNKKVMRESMEYIIDNVIAHEYAHALLFKNMSYQNGEEGHSALWQKTCVKLGGANCQKYVDSHDVIMQKLPF